MASFVLGILAILHIPWLLILWAALWIAPASSLGFVHFMRKVPVASGVAIVLGVVAWRRYRRSDTFRGKWLAIAGLVTGGLALWWTHIYW